jgi:flagellar FliL protein
MAKSEDKKPAKTEGEGGDAAAEKPKGLFANKKKLIIFAAAGLLLLGGVGAAAYLFLFSGGEETAAAEGGDAHGGGHGEAKADPHGGGKADDHGGGHGDAKADAHGGAKADGHGGGHGEAAAHGVPGAPLFFDLPAILVNLRSDDKPVFLKLVVSLEVKDSETLRAVEAVLPRVVDQFQTYLRELRVEELSGSAATYRLKEELLRRVKIAAAPMDVSDVLFKDMIIQ